MDKRKSFKERVKDAVIHNAVLYKKYYVDCEYLICSKAFVKNEYYIISANEDNYLHLTGVNTELDAKTFFRKCLAGNLNESDFNFVKKGQAERDVKGSVRRKVNSLPGIMNLFSEGTMVEEDFVKNRIRCRLAAGSVTSTLGFVVSGTAKPMTLLKGNELDKEKSSTLELVLHKQKGDSAFSEIIVGNREKLKAYENSIKDLMDKKLLE